MAKIPPELQAKMDRVSEASSALLVCVNIERLLLRARSILDGMNHLDGDEERERAAVVNELDEVLHAMAGIEGKRT